jgi:hypothetical protein
LGAPHTTFFISFSPKSTSQTFSRSAFGCFSVFKIFATLNKSRPADKFSTLSTSSPEAFKTIVQKACPHLILYLNDLLTNQM